MHSHTRSHTSIFATHWSPTNAALTILLVLLFLIFLLVFLNITAVPAQAQTSVPPTARQAASMPQFAARLAHAASSQIASRAPYSAQPRASYKNPLDPRARTHRGGPLDDSTLYENGPINGTTDAWTINFGFVVGDTFTVPSSGASVNGLVFGAWAEPGDVLENANVGITSSAFGGTIYFDGVVNFTQSACSANQYGYNVCTESGTFGSVNLAAGTYWVSLSNAVVNTGDPIYWDENSGVGCDSPGCPSQAEDEGVGTIPSEAFTVEGTTCLFNCPPQCVGNVPQDGFELIHNFSASEQSPAPGLAIDQVGRLYGASGGGNNGEGLAYQLAPSGQNWIFTPLYSFLGGANGQNPLPGIIGPEGAVYGTASGGIQTCGSSGNQYCGVVYRLRPSPVACLTALCSWTESVIYQFTGDPDGWSPNGNLVFDPAGNLYGTTLNGGAYGRGTVYELSPSDGGWTERVIYSFTASDGDGPNSLLMGHDGNLYGTTFVGGHGGGVAFQLVPSGGGWTEQIIASFAPCSSYYSCSPVLVQENSGNLYGVDPYDVYLCPPPGCLWNKYATIFAMSPSDGGWQVTIIDDTRYYWFGNWLDPTGYDLYYDVTIDAAGNLYATEGGYTPGAGGDYYWGNVIKVLGGPPQDRFLVGFAGDDFRDLEVGAGGNLYGTTGACGGSPGTVWQLTP